MATSVPIDEDTAARLERLRSVIERETGRAVSQRELLDRIVAREYDSRETLVDSYAGEANDGDDDREELSDEEIERWLSGTAASGDPVGEDGIDGVLYGGEDTDE